MSKIADLIKEECPNGVEYKRLNDVVSVNRGSRLTKSQLNENGKYEVYHGSKDTPLGLYDNFNTKGDTVIVVNTGGIGGVKYLENDFWCSDGSFNISHCTELNNKFLYHFLQQYEGYFQQQKRVGGVPTIDKQIVEKIKIPVPPLEIQEEIVMILDEFSALEAELEAELEARKNQYEFWRDNLLNKEGKLYKLKELAHYSTDRIKFDELDENNYVGVDNLLQNKLGRKIANYIPKTGNSTKFENGDILIGNIRPYLKKIWLSDITGGTNGDVLTIKVIDKNIIEPRYLYYILSSDDFFNYDNQNSKGVKMPRGDKQMIMQYEFLVPSIDKQEKIIMILDKFDRLINDISEGLPAEIELRKQQYEYYRNKLLCFEEFNNE